MRRPAWLRTWMPSCSTPATRALKVKELGGTGRRHDWAISRQIRERVDVPVWLAGGLDPENARDAIETVGPFALDLCSGIRTGEGYDLDPDKLERFMAAVAGG